MLARILLAGAAVRLGRAAPDEHGLACSTHAPSDRAAAIIRDELAQQSSSPPPYQFPAAYVAKALSSSVDYRYAGQNPAGVVAVTPAKDQGAHGCVIGRLCTLLSHSN